MKVDDIYGPKTEQAVLNFQRRYANLAHDGAFGPRTFVELLRHVEQSGALKQAAEAGARVAADGEAVGSEATGDRAVQLAREYGTGLGLAITQSGPSPNLRDAFSPSTETGAYDADALEVAAVLKIPHRTDIPMTRKILDRDGDILYAAIGAQEQVLADERRRQRQGSPSRRR